MATRIRRAGRSAALPPLRGGACGPEPRGIEALTMRRRREARRLDVVVGTFVYTGTPFATYELGLSGPTSKVVVTGSGGDGYEAVLRGMLRALAVLGFRGEVRLRPAGNAFEDGGREAFAALERYAATFVITDEYAEQVKAEQVKAEEVEQG